MEPTLRNSLLTALTALVFGFLGAAAWSYFGLADNRTRTYLVENPSILQEVAEALAAEEARERLASREHIDIHRWSADAAVCA